LLRDGKQRRHADINLYLDPVAIEPRKETGLGVLLGEALGYARTIRIRAALRQLYGEGVVADPPKGDLQWFTVRPGAAV
jgi:hypothetical protein